MPSMVHISNKLLTVDPRIDALITKHKDAVQSLTGTDEWVSEVATAVGYLASRVTEFDDRLSKSQGFCDIDSILVRNDLDELRERIIVLEKPAAPVVSIKQFDDTGLRSLVASLEKVAVETANHVDQLGGKTETDVRQLRTDLLRLAAKVQKLEQPIQRSPWYQRLLFWKRK